MTKISDKKIRKIYEAHKDKLSISEIAAEAGVCKSTVSKYLKKSDIPPNYETNKTKIKNIPMDVLIEDIFESPDEELYFSDILKRMEEYMEKPIMKKVVQKSIEEAIELGLYEKFETAEGIVYKRKLPL